MTDKTNEPETAAGRHYALQPPGSLDEWKEAILAIEAEAAAAWKRKYDGMVKERDDQIHRKRETRRILTDRLAPPAEAVALLRWVDSMPDAGLNSDNPRWDWWHDGAMIRVAARTALANQPAAAKPLSEGTCPRCGTYIIRYTPAPEAGEAVRLREAVETEWQNGNLSEDTMDRILATQPTPEAGEAVRGHIPSRTCWCVPIETEGRLQHLAPADPVAKEVEIIERAIHPEGRCLDCGGGKPYWQHDPSRGDDYHPFRAPVAKQPEKQWHNDGDECIGPHCGNPEHGWSEAKQPEGVRASVLMQVKCEACPHVREAHPDGGGCIACGCHEFEWPERPVAKQRLRDKPFDGWTIADAWEEWHDEACQRDAAGCACPCHYPFSRLVTPTDPVATKPIGWHGDGTLCGGKDCPVLDEHGDHPTPDAHSNDWYDGYAAGQKDADPVAKQPEGLDVERWTFRDPDGSGFCSRCFMPIAIHPLDEHGDDVDRCPDQPARLAATDPEAQPWEAALIDGFDGGPAMMCDDCAKTTAGRCWKHGRTWSDASAEIWRTQKNQPAPEAGENEDDFTRGYRLGNRDGIEFGREQAKQSEQRLRGVLALIADGRGPAREMAAAVLAATDPEAKP